MSDLSFAEAAKVAKRAGAWQNDESSPGHSLHPRSVARVPSPEHNAQKRDIS